LNKPNEIAIELENGLHIQAQTEAWVLGILSILDPSELQRVLNYLEANKAHVGDAADLHTADGRRVHMLGGSLEG
jgi:hypothetical protein